MEIKNKRNITSLIQLYIKTKIGKKTSHKEIHKALYIFDLVLLQLKHLIDENFNTFNDENLLQKGTHDKHFAQYIFWGFFLSRYPIRDNILVKDLCDWLNKIYQKMSNINNQLKIFIK